ncbi:MAG TPA: hypothetical protein VFP40_14865 [Terriglobales bacterium]|nr:hypothetical protein [Terriglobales bacterium]
MLSFVDEGRKRVLVIAASILVARHMKDMSEGRTPRTEALIANAVRLAARVMQKVDSLAESYAASVRRQP